MQRQCAVSPSASLRRPRLRARPPPWVLKLTYQLPGPAAIQCLLACHCRHCSLATTATARPPPLPLLACHRCHCSSATSATERLSLLPLLACHYSPATSATARLPPLPLLTIHGSFGCYKFIWSCGCCCQGNVKECLRPSTRNWTQLKEVILTSLVR